ncbi:tumor protein D54-like [Pollicipes pollicipes]|uniref:tumor protein D54-like n=1 Tax=Pollicipes pollicipes TaxID=41117 RepID=UPI0018852DFD|nr:tumor protein D54-like [Pollicipes pollicipes]XP_037082637.1 tumor protein D54-like [Pollicipes pollicipes]
MAAEDVRVAEPPKPEMDEDKPMSLYQKTEAALKTTGEKASGLFAGLGAKFSEARESATFKSVEERVGTMVTTVKSKVSSSRSNSTQSFDEALKEAEAAKKQAEGAAPAAAPEEKPQ